jgi:phage shock protein A
VITRRIRRLVAALTGKAVGRLEVDNADALLELESENLRTLVGRYNEGLATHAGVCDRLRRRIGSLEGEAERARTLALECLSGGDRVRAAKHALAEERLREDMDRHRTELGEAEASYQELVRTRRVAVEAAREKIEGLRRTIGTARVQTALAELTEMAASLHGAVGLSGGDLDRLRDQMDERRALAAGRVRVAREMLDLDQQHGDEEREAARAVAALTRLEASVDSPLGLPPPSP